MGVMGQRGGDDDGEGSQTQPTRSAHHLHSAQEQQAACSRRGR
jgi:hypothetical protein